MSKSHFVLMQFNLWGPLRCISIIRDRIDGKVHKIILAIDIDLIALKFISLLNYIIFSLEPKQDPQSWTIREKSPVIFNINTRSAITTTVTCKGVLGIFIQFPLAHYSMIGFKWCFSHVIKGPCLFQYSFSVNCNGWICFLII